MLEEQETNKMREKVTREHNNKLTTSNTQFILSAASNHNEQLYFLPLRKTLSLDVFKNSEWLK